MIRLLMVVSLVAAGCGSKDEKKQAEPEPVTVDFALSKLMLETDPGEALAVEDAKDVAPKDEVTVVGRIDNIVKGYATFNIVDEVLDYCGTGGDPMEECPTPWDYCCTNPGVKADATMTIDVRGADGQVVKSAVPFRLLDLVVVKGKLVKDEHGNVTVHATNWFRRERPKLPDGLRWPE
jgi:hypothetical protein